MEDWVYDVDQWAANQDDCPEFAIFERKLSKSDVNCLGYGLMAAKGIQPGEISLRRQLKILSASDHQRLQDDFNSQLLVRNLMQRSIFVDDIKQSITDDGLIKVNGSGELLRDGYYPVVLFFTQEPGSSEHLDFHFVRYNSNGIWSWIPGIGEPIACNATDPDTLEDAKVTNPFKVKWPAKQHADSIWLVPKGGYETLLLGQSAETLLRRKDADYEADI